MHFIAIVSFQHLKAAHLMFKTITLQLFPPTMVLASNFPSNAENITQLSVIGNKSLLQESKLNLNLLLEKVSPRWKIEHVTMSFYQSKGQN